MSIWLWIIAAWLLSYLVLDKKDVHPRHLLWMLLPVDMYGINLFGVTIKPYMLFCLWLLLKRIAEGRNRLLLHDPWLLRGLFAIFACIVVNTINCRELGSVMGTFMMLVVWGCVLIYMSEYDSSSRDSICRILQATGIGHGLVFVVGYLLMQLYPEFPGLIAMERSLPGIFMRNANMAGGVLVSTFRLRGFTIDPNPMVGTFLYCTIVSLLQLVRRKAGIREVLGIVLSVICVLLSGSRMGLISLLLCFVISLFAGRAIHRQRVERILLVSGFVLAGIFIVIVLTGTLNSIISAFLMNYSNRSGLTDNYGRFTIWKEAISVWMNQSPFLGIGIGQMQYYTSMARACHNSWLEMLCAWGALVGGAVICHFVAPVLSGLRCAVQYPAVRKEIFFWAMLLGTLGVMAALFTVDNITYSYLWFGLAMVAAIAAGEWKGEAE